MEREEGLVRVSFCEERVRLVGNVAREFRQWLMQGHDGQCIDGKESQSASDSDGFEFVSRIQRRSVAVLSANTNPARNSRRAPLSL